METYSDITKKHMLTVKEMGILEDEIDITIEELKEISTDLGMTEEGWSHVMKEAEKKLVLAESHLKHKSYREGILASEDALLLNPYIKGARGIKAKAYLLLAINESDNSYLDRAERQAQITLNKESNDKNALEVMATISSKNRLIKDDKKKNPNKKLIMILGVFIVFALGLVGFLYFSSSAPGNVANQEIQNVEKQLESAFEKQQALVPKIEALLTGSELDQQDKIEMTEIKTKLNKAENLKEKYDLQVELNEVLSGVIYRKSNEKESQLLDDLRVLLEGAENRIKTERKNYNEALTKYNNASSNNLEKL